MTDNKWRVRLDRTSAEDGLSVASRVPRDNDRLCHHFGSEYRKPLP
jgi:hypothetical protein